MVLSHITKFLWCPGRIPRWNNPSTLHTTLKIRTRDSFEGAGLGGGGGLRDGGVGDGWMGVVMVLRWMEGEGRGGDWLDCYHDG